LNAPDREVRSGLGGRAIDRRTALRLGGGAVLGLALAGCGTTTAVHPNRSAYAIDANGTSPPIGDLARLIATRARAVGMAPTLSALGGQLTPAALTVQTRLGQFDPETNRTPPVTDLVVVGAADPVAIGPATATAIRHGATIVGYPIALRHQTAAVLADVATAIAMLAAHAGAWSQGQSGGSAQVLLVLPPVAPSVNPYAAFPARTEAMFRAALVRTAPGLTIAATTQAQFASDGQLAVARALATRPDVRVVLVWDDDTALGAARVLRGRPDVFVGALGAPAVTSRATFGELQRGDALRVVIAAGVRDLAYALVDLPRRLLGGAAAHDVTLPWHVLTPGSSTLAQYSRDYALQPSSTNYDNTALTPPTFN